MKRLRPPNGSKPWPLQCEWRSEGFCTDVLYQVSPDEMMLCEVHLEEWERMVSASDDVTYETKRLSDAEVASGQRPRPLD